MNLFTKREISRILDFLSDTQIRGKEAHEMVGIVDKLLSLLREEESEPEFDPQPAAPSESPFRPVKPGELKKAVEVDVK